MVFAHSEQFYRHLGRIPATFIDIATVYHSYIGSFKNFWSVVKIDDVVS